MKDVKVACMVQAEAALWSVAVSYGAFNPCHEAAVRGAERRAKRRLRERVRPLKSSKFRRLARGMDDVRMHRSGANNSVMSWSVGVFDFA